MVIDVLSYEVRRRNAVRQSFEHRTTNLCRKRFHETGPWSH